MDCSLTMKLFNSFLLKVDMCQKQTHIGCCVKYGVRFHEVLVQFKDSCYIATPAIDT